MNNAELLPFLCGSKYDRRTGGLAVSSSADVLWRWAFGLSLTRTSPLRKSTLLPNRPDDRRHRARVVGSQHGGADGDGEQEDEPVP